MRAALALALVLAAAGPTRGGGGGDDWGDDTNTTTATPEVTKLTCSDALEDVPFPDACAVVRNTADCEPEGLVDAVGLAFCRMGPSASGAVVLLGIWTSIVFLGLGCTADAFLCPNLIALSQGLGIPEHIAGVTLLAFGNGAPDLFAAFSAITRGPESASLAFGALLGAGLFIATVVVGTIAISMPFQFKRRPLFRDALLFLFATLWSMYVLHDGKIDLGDAIGFVVLYVMYVVLVIVGHAVYKTEAFKQNDPLRPKMAISETMPLMGDSQVDRSPVADISIESITQHPLEPIIRHPLAFLVPVDLAAWAGASNAGKAVQVVCAPIIFVLQVTTPAVHTTADGTVDPARWSKPLLCIQCMLGPLAATWIADPGFIADPDFVTGWVVIGVGAALATVVMLTTHRDRPPRLYHWVAAPGFLVAVFWIFLIADQAVDVLTAIGLVVGASDAIIGLLVLGLGNSVGDFIANVVVARAGHPTMAASACYGAPALNLLLGIGASYLYVIAKSGTTNVFENIDDEIIQLNTAGYFLVATLVLTLVWAVKRNFVADRIFGWSLVAIYAVSLGTAVALEIGA